MPDKTARIGGVPGFWGDSAMSGPQLLCCNDSLGKAYAQMLLDFPVEAPAAWGLTAEGGQAAA